MTCRNRYLMGGPSAGGDVVDLSAPTPPAPQSLANSATTASVTWTHADAPAGTTYALAVIDEAGSTVTPDSGSGLGPYVFPVAAGKSYSARLRATGTDGQTAQSSALVAVAGASGGPGWDVTLDLDLTGLDSLTLTDAAETVVTRDSVAVATVWVDEVSNGGGTVTAGATGLVIDGNASTGSTTALIDLAAAAGITLPDDIMSGIAVDIYLDGLGDWTGSGTAWRAGVSPVQGRFSVNDGNTVQGRLNGSNQDRRIATNESFTTWAANEATPAGAWVITLRIDSGGLLWAWYGTAPATDAALDSLSGAVLLSSTITADIADAPADTRYGTLLYAGAMAQLQAVFTWTRLRLRTRRT